MSYTELTLPKTSLPRDPLACCPYWGTQGLTHSAPASLPRTPAYGISRLIMMVLDFVLPTSLPASEPLPMLFPLTIYSSLNSSAFFSV